MNLFGKDGYPDRQVDHPSYQLAIKATGLDLSTLQNYAYVSRSVPYSVRSERLSWEHHRLLAKLPDADMQGWIKTFEAEEEAGRRMSTRRLRKSLALGRVATVAGASCARPSAGRLAPRIPNPRHIRPPRVK